jgi:hypothetical protein
MSNPVVENRLSEQLTKLKWRHSRVNWPNTGLVRIYDVFHAPLGAPAVGQPVTVEVDALSKPTRDVRVKARAGGWQRLADCDAATRASVTALVSDLQAAGFFV